MHEIYHGVECIGVEQIASLKFVLESEQMLLFYLFIHSFIYFPCLLFYVTDNIGAFGFKLKHYLGWYYVGGILLYI